MPYSLRRRPITKPPPGSRVETGHPLAQSLCGLWLFNDRGGAKVAPAGEIKVPAATFTGTPVWSALAGGSLQTSSGNYVQNASNNQWLASGTGQITVTALVYPTTATQDAGLVSRWEGGQQEYLLYLGDDGALNAARMIVMQGTGTTVSAGVSGLVVANQVQMWTGVADGTNVLLYKDGLLVAGPVSYNGTIISTNTSGLFFGALRSDGLYPFAGNLILTALWNRGLKATEVLSLCQNPYQLVAARTLSVAQALLATIKERRTLAPRVGTRGVMW